MNAKQQRFVAEYLVDLNATQAAIRAGYSEKTANRIGSRLLSKVDISQAIAAGKSKQLQQVDVNATKVLRELSRIAFSDLRDMFDGESLKRPSAWSDDAAAGVASIEVETRRRYLAGGESEPFDVTKIKRWDKLRALEMLAKHLGVLKDGAADGDDTQTLEIVFTNATDPPPHTDDSLSDE